MSLRKFLQQRKHDVPGDHTVNRKETRTLELSRFIADTLLEIIYGVEETRGKISELETNAIVCPTGLYWKGDSPGPYVPGRGFVTEVAFDVAVTVSESQSKEMAGKGELSVGVPALSWLGGATVGAEASHTREQGRSSLSRISFKIPMLLPSTLEKAGLERQMAAAQHKQDQDERQRQQLEGAQAASLGYELCRAHFPPGIMLSEDGVVWKCPECGSETDQKSDALETPGE